MIWPNQNILKFLYFREEKVCDKTPIIFLLQKFYKIQKSPTFIISQLSQIKNSTWNE
jgi:hypothetical protein